MKKPGAVVKFTIAGVLFGLIFPILSTLIELIEFNQPFSFSAFLSMQRSNPLLWVIDLAVPIFGFVGFLIGRQQQKLMHQAENLEYQVETRSDQILKQKLFYEALVENNPVAIVTLDPQHRILSANPAFEAIFKFSANEILGKNLDELISDQTTEQEAHSLTKNVLSGKTIHQTGKRRRSDGSLVDVEILGKPILIDGKLRGVLGLYRDITAEKIAREELEASEARFRSLFQNSPIALRLEDFSAIHNRVKVIEQTFGLSLKKYFASNPDKITGLLALAKIISANDATLSLFQAQGLEELQNHIGLILSDESRQNAIDIVIALTAGEKSIEQELIYKTLDGKKKVMITKLTLLPGHESDWSRALFSNMDITDRKMAEERMSFISLHDMMTGLYNRVYFDEELARLEKSRIRPVSILVCDMDNLKVINDRFGHAEGDIALQNIANILKGCFRTEDVIARIGGDEFAILLPNVSAELAERIIQRIERDIANHNSKGVQEEQIGLSVGSATAEKGQGLVETFKTADDNMYCVKQKKKGINCN